MRVYRYYKEYSRNYYQVNKERMLKRNNEYNRTHKVEKAGQHQKRALALKTKVLVHYGGGRLACVRCGFSNIKALTIDHINGGGMEHRLLIGGSGGLRMYKWLEKNNYPIGYQTLCSNCNMIKELENKENCVSRRLIKSEVNSHQ